MSFGGPLPKPQAIEEAQGNPSKAKKIKVPKPKTKGTVKPPKDLSPDALKIWNELAPELIQMELLYQVDAHLFAQFCDATDLYWSLRKELEGQWVFISHNQSGDQYQQINVKANLMHQAFTRAEKLANHFGLSPASRTRLGRMLDENKTDPLESIIGKKPE